MVNYKTRIFFEPDTNSLGADVIIYSEEGDKIDTILVTTESKYNELAEQIENIDDTYIDLNELHTILANVQNDLIINATKFQGYDLDQFSLVGHTHNEYAQKNHAASSQTYGVGSASRYGHTKVIDNLTSTQYVAGESLSANQGKVLKNLIDQNNEAIIGDTISTFNNPTTNAGICRITLKKVGNIVFCQYLVVFKAPSQANLNKDLKVSNTDIPEGFRPAGDNTYFSVAEYDSSNNMLLYFKSDGKIYCRGYQRTQISAYGSCFWFTDI
ncbi:hypothetical protein [Methanobrevibacter sp.]|uniref:hypothetical protein n=1 Tax=Methanobrevibacter sp. TaxID=66852 RepID=UPI00388ECA60